MNGSTAINGNLMSKSLSPKPVLSFVGCFVLLSCLLFPLLPNFTQTLEAQETSSRAYAIKAGFIYNFTRFIKWPSPSKFNSSNNDYNICVIGDNPFGSILDRLEKKHRSKKHPLKIKHDVTSNDFEGCHILFVSFSERFNVEKIVEAARDHQVLTVGDTEGYAERGIDINLLVIKNKVRFEISKNCVSEKGFKVSSELYDLATIVEGGCQ